MKSSVTRFGFLIDQDTCIGCHACTVACKAEHDVPLGVNRTWVKYIEKGAFPNARRFYSVLRCNHCDDAPCVTICPTGALFRRDNGIVDFDDSVCIGCKSCMNACPYDAIYINPETDTAHKCNFCAHRVEIGLEPSCVVVCPTQSIVAGDLDDPTSKISVMLARHDTKVRAPEQGTRPKLFYKGADEAALAAHRDRGRRDDLGRHPPRPPHGRASREAPPERHGPGRGPDRVHHRAPQAPWKGKVSAYLVTKAVSAGALMVAALAVLTGHADERDLVGLVAPLVALVFAAITGALLIADLRQPRRFALIFLRPQWGSWLVRGAVILAVYGALALLWLLGGLLDQPDLVRVVALPAAAAGRRDGRVHGVPVRPVRGPGPLADTAAAAHPPGPGGGGRRRRAPGAGAPFDLAEPIVTTLLWALVGGVGAVGGPAVLRAVLT